MRAVSHCHAICCLTSYVAGAIEIDAGSWDFLADSASPRERTETRRSCTDESSVKGHEVKKKQTNRYKFRNFWIDEKVRWLAAWLAQD